MKTAPLPVLLLALLAGCQGEAPPSASTAVPENVPRRIIALAPNLSETLFALGLGDRVVGVGDYSTWPPEAARLPRLGGLYDANLERIVSLRPDLAVLLPSEKDLGAQLAPLGIETLTVTNESLEDVERSFQAIAERCGVPEAGERLAKEWRATLAPRPVSGPEAGKPRVLLSVGRQEGRMADVLAAGPGTFLDELLRRLGAVNVFGDAGMLYPQVSLEAIVARRPDVILELRADEVPPAVAETLAGDWSRLGELPAVRSGRIHVIGGGHVVTPGPRLPRLYAEMRAALERGAPAR